MATILTHTTRAAGTLLTASIYNEDHLRHVTNAEALNEAIGDTDITDVLQAKVDAEAAAALAEQWAGEPEDSEVEPGQFSALHHAAKASASAASVATSESNASGSATQASASEDKAQKWAEEAEDVEVEPGSFSAFHWAQKSREGIDGFKLKSDTPSEILFDGKRLAEGQWEEAVYQDAKDNTTRLRQIVSAFAGSYGHIRFDGSYHFGDDDDGNPLTDAGKPTELGGMRFSGQFPPGSPRDTFADFGKVHRLIFHPKVAPRARDLPLAGSHIYIIREGWKKARTRAEIEAGVSGDVCKYPFDGVVMREVWDIVQAYEGIGLHLDNSSDSHLEHIYLCGWETGLYTDGASRPKARDLVIDSYNGIRLNRSGGPPDIDVFCRSSVSLGLQGDNPCFFPIIGVANNGGNLQLEIGPTISWPGIDPPTAWVSGTNYPGRALVYSTGSDAVTRLYERGNSSGVGYNPTTGSTDDPKSIRFGDGLVELGDKTRWRCLRVNLTLDGSGNPYFALANDLDPDSNKEGSLTGPGFLQAGDHVVACVPPELLAGGERPYINDTSSIYHEQPDARARGYVEILSKDTPQSATSAKWTLNLAWDAVNHPNWVGHSILVSSLWYPGIGICASRCDTGHIKATVKSQAVALSTVNVAPLNITLNTEHPARGRDAGGVSPGGNAMGSLPSVAIWIGPNSHRLIGEVHAKSHGTLILHDSDHAQNNNILVGEFRAAAYREIQQYGGILHIPYGLFRSKGITEDSSLNIITVRLTGSARRLVLGECVEFAQRVSVIGTGAAAKIHRGMTSRVQLVDADVNTTLTYGVDGPIVEDKTTLTAQRRFSLQPGNMRVGAYFDIVFNGVTGGFSRTIWDDVNGVQIATLSTVGARVRAWWEDSEGKFRVLP